MVPSEHPTQGAAAGLRAHDPLTNPAGWNTVGGNWQRFLDVVATVRTAAPRLHTTPHDLGNPSYCKHAALPCPVGATAQPAYATAVIIIIVTKNPVT